MKKLSILLIGLLLLTGLVFAQDFAPTVDFSGSGTVTFGVNLDGGSTGFTNDYSASIDVTFVQDFNGTSMGEGPIYGKIVINHIASYLSGAATTSDLSLDNASIVAGNLRVKIAGAPGINTDLEAALWGGTLIPIPQDHSKAGVYTDLASIQGTPRGQVGTAIATTGGVTIYYAVPSITNLEVGLASVTNWDVDSAVNTQANDYAFYAQAAVIAVPNLTVTLRADTGLGLDGVEYPLGAGAKATYAVTAGDFTITPNVAADMYKAAGATDFAIAIGNGLRVATKGPNDFSPPHGWPAVTGTGFHPGYTVDSGLTVGYSVLLPAGGGDPVLNLNASVVEDEKTGFVPGLGAILAVGINDVLAAGDLQLGLGAQLSYVLADNMTAWGRLAMSTTTLGGTTIWLGMDIDPLFPLTSLAIRYESGNLQDAAGAQLGELTAAVTVSY